jgi:hypothetical protein
MRVWVDQEITLHLIRDSAIQERLFNEFMNASGLGLSLFYPVAIGETSHSMDSKLGQLFQSAFRAEYAWKIMKAKSGVEALSGYQCVGSYGDYTIAIDRGDRLSNLGASQSEIVDVGVLEADFQYLLAQSKYFPKGLTTRPSVVQAYLFSRAYRSDIIYTCSSEMVDSLQQIFALTNTAIQVIRIDLTTELTGSSLASDRAKSLEMIWFDAFAKRFGELSHNFFSQIPLEAGHNTKFVGEVTIQPTFGARFEAHVSPQSSQDLLLTVLQNRILAGVIQQDEARSIAHRLPDITEILTNQTRSLEDVQRQLEEIISSLPASRSLFKDLIHNTSANLLASNILDVIRLVLSRYVS